VVLAILQVLVYFAVAKKGDPPTDGKTDVNPEGLTAGTRNTVPGRDEWYLIAAVRHRLSLAVACGVLRLLFASAAFCAWGSMVQQCSIQINWIYRGHQGMETGQRA
jgi:hypothetical protein